MIVYTERGYWLSTLDPAAEEMSMDMRDLEEEVQRSVGYDCFVTSGVADKGPFLNFNGKQRLLRIWVPRSGMDAKKIAGMARDYFSDDKAPAYKELTYLSA
jgi:hypothetical protein